ncbi:MAG: T9SS type A sorting domain-containing protein [Saprospiraceae bacterium]|nr:T9SS type A sorting domain-containing protein [Saprospiraceae bacterium]
MKHKSNLLLSILVFGWTALFAQWEDYNWMLGASSPQSDSTWSRIHWTFKDDNSYSEYRTYKVEHLLEFTNASISDNSGKLLFYTNGRSVFNRDYQKMPNGDGLNPGRYANSSMETGYKLIHGAIILPWPEHPGKYFIFHVTTDNIPFVWYSLNLFTTLVDMDLDLGKGDVVYKNKSVYADSLVNGSLSACRHANGRDWWLPSFYYSGKKCFMFLLDPTGVSLHHVQDIPHTFETSGRGQSQFSPDGTRYAFFHQNSYSYREFFLADFDRCTGLFTNIEYSTMPRFDIAALAFSPNSRFIYLGTAYELYQLDLSKKDAFKNRLRVDSIDGFSSFPLFTSYFSFMQLAPDQKIYINNGRGPDYLSTIEKPDLEGKDCDVRQHNIHITSNATIPNFPYFRLGAMDGSLCDTLARGRLPLAQWSAKKDSTKPLKVNFTDSSLYQVREWYWNFGDPGSGLNESRLPNPAHEFSKDGMYNVCLVVKNEIGTDTFCNNVNVEIVSTNDMYRDHETLKEIQIIPNPFSEYIHINIPTRKKLKYQLYNMLGSQLRIDELNNENNTIEMKEYPNGIYRIVILEEEKKIYTSLLMKVGM